MKKRKKPTKAQRLANREKMRAYRAANPEKVRESRAKYEAKRPPRKKNKDQADKPAVKYTPAPTDHSQDPACIAIRERFHAYRQNLRKS